MLYYDMAVLQGDPTTPVHIKELIGTKPEYLSVVDVQGALLKEAGARVANELVSLRASQSEIHVQSAQITQLVQIRDLQKANLE